MPVYGSRGNIRRIATATEPFQTGVVGADHYIGIQVGEEVHALSRGGGIAR
jgi:hypothetical protein